MNPRRTAQLAAFREAATERLSRLGVAWIQVESQVAPAATVAEILRELHTLKGEAGILGFTAASDLVHVLEAAIQRGAEDRGDSVLQAFDVLAEIVQGAPEAAPPAAHASLLALLGDGDAPAPPPQVPEPAAPIAVEPATAAGPRKLGLRVAADQLDRMRDAIGDLLSLRIRLAHLAEELSEMRKDPSRANLDAKLKRSEARLRDDAVALNVLAGSLEETVRDLRLVPVGSVLERYPRVARDLGRDLGKPVRVLLEGESAVIDRNVIEALDNAMMHLIRNAVDHGIEAPDLRRAQQKPELGTIRIAAKVGASRVQVTIADDGGGIDVAAIRRVAVERGLVDARVEADDERALQWILLPGFTTRKTATQVSGRGVGLDAVHATVQALGGSLELTSQRGLGTTFSLSVPINTAITSVVLFKVGEARYALPTTSVEDIVDGQEYRFEDSFAGQVISYRGSDIPVVSLPALLGRTSQWNQRRRLAIVRTGLGLIACSGSRDHEHREAVMRPAGTLLSSQTVATAAIVLEDGELALVLNPARLRQKQQAVETVIPAATTVMVADDSPIVRDLICEVLRSHGLIVIEATDGQDALEKLEVHGEVTLLVTDVEMPRMSGLELLRNVRSNAARRLPVVVVSTRGSDEDKRLAASIGADAYLVKTDLTHDSLWTLISRFVGS
jgi:chemotaxis protein histidine kinase CheA